MRNHMGFSWWCHQMETFSTLLSLCAGNSPVTGEFPAQRPVTWSFGVSFDLHLNKRLSKQSWGWRFETPSWPCWCQRSVLSVVFDSRSQWHPWCKRRLLIKEFYRDLVDHFSHLPATFCRGNKNIYLYFMSFLYINIAQEVGILP